MKLQMTIEDSECILDDNICWMCGKVFTTNDCKITDRKTMHHTLPRHFKPVKNVVVPVCQDCHNKLNQHDTAGLIQFTKKMMYQIKDWFYCVNGNMRRVEKGEMRRQTK